VPNGYADSPLVSLSADGSTSTSGPGAAALGAANGLAGFIGKTSPFSGFKSNVANPWQDEDRARQTASIAEGAGYNSADAANQQALIAALQARANGTGGDSLADMQLRSATDRNLNQAAGLQAGQHGVSAGLAQRQLQNQQAGIAQNYAAQSGMQRLNEQNDAQALLMQALNGSREQNLGQMQAGEQNNLGNKGLAVQAGLGNAGINAGTANANAKVGGSLWGAVANGAGKILGLAHGGVVPGVDHGVDEVIAPVAAPQPPIALRPGEVVVNQESPLYHAALLDALKRAPQGPRTPKPQPASSPLLEALRAHFMGDGMGANGGAGFAQTMGVGG
jgi:hypothetical protein